MKRLRALLSVYACRPNWGSEPGVGWNMARELAKYHDVWVLTRYDNYPFIEAELNTNSIEGLHLVFCDLPGVKFWKRSSQIVYFHYYLWQIAAYFTARRLNREVQFDIVHHVTYVTYSTPSFLSFLPIPFIWGPVGGGESTPQDFLNDFDWYGKNYELLRYLMHWIGERDPFVSITARKSALVNATTEDTAIRLTKLGAKTVKIHSQVGLSAEEISQLAKLEINLTAPFRFVSIGRLLHWKGFHLGLRAFAQADLPSDAEYWIIGEGRERDCLQRLADQLGIGQSVKFWGNLPRKDVLLKLGWCHALVHPSLHESGGFVCLEAMAAGRPVICLDLGGPALQVTEENGFKIFAANSQEAVSRISIAMVTLARNPELVIKMGKAGRERAKEVFAWSKKGLFWAKIYEQLNQK